MVEQKLFAVNKYRWRKKRTCWVTNDAIMRGRRLEVMILLRVKAATKRKYSDVFRLQRFYFAYSLQCDRWLAEFCFVSVCDTNQLHLLIKHGLWRFFLNLCYKFFLFMLLQSSPFSVLFIFTCALLYLYLYKVFFRSCLGFPSSLLQYDEKVHRWNCSCGIKSSFQNSPIFVAINFGRH